MKKKDDSLLSFEKGMEQLKRISESLESGDLTLEDSLKNFEEGIHIYRLLNEKLNAAELKIETIVEEVHMDESGEN